MPIKLLRKLEEKARVINYAEVAKDSSNVLERCEYTFRVFETIKKQLEDLAPTIEQLKGIHNGMKRAAPIAAQHKEIWKVQCQNEEIGKDEFIAKAAVVDKCVQSIMDAAVKQHDELLMTAGKADGLYASADQALKQIEVYLTNLKSQEQFMKANPDLFANGGNGKKDTMAGNTVVTDAPVSPKNLKAKKQKVKTAN
jgi:hypothetical protein